MKKKLFRIGVFSSLFTLSFFNHLNAQIQDRSTPPSFLMPVLNGQDQIPQVQLAMPDMNQIDYEDNNTHPMGEIPRVGVSISSDISLTNSGKWTYLPNGNRIWRLKIHVPGAASLGLYYDDFFIPNGAKLYIYDPSHNEIQGGFTSSSNQASGTFATSPTSGETIIIEYFEPALVTGQGRIHINEVAYIYRNWDLYKDIDNSRDFGDSGPCEVNVNCSPEGNGKTNQRDGVVRILVKVGAQFGWCSGSLVNNVRQDCTPYLLTALHCGITASNVLTTSADLNQWVFYFNYQAPGCTNPGSQGTLANSFITGGTHRSNSNDAGGDTGSDFLLLQLNTTPPTGYNPHYNGWNRNNTATTGGYGIHHPAGDIKKISTFNGTTASTSWGGSVANTHWQVTWSATTNGHGVTEGGSSGSPLFNSSGQIIGTLTGGGSFCNTPTAPDAYGKFSYHWQSNGATSNRRLRDWLDPDNTGVTTLSGIYAPCSVINLDAGIVDVLNPPNGEFICDSIISPVVVIQNFGTTTLTSATINYRINASPNNTFSWTGSLTTSQTDTVTLPNITVPTGAALNFISYTTAPNSGSDGLTSNDTTTVVSQYSQSLPLPYTQPFETGSIPANITIYDPDGDGFDWAYRSGVSGFGVGTGCVWYDNFGGTSGSNPGGTLDWMILPDLDFSNVSTATLTFDVAYRRYNTTTNDSLIVAVATNCGNLYTIEFFQGGTLLQTVGTTSTTNFVPTSTQWATKTVNLNSYVGNDHVSVAFINYSDWGNNIYVDNINIQGTPLCRDTTYNVNASICSGQTYTLPNGTVVSTGGTYNSNFTSYRGCDSNFVTVLTVNSLPTVGVSGGSSQSVCSGSSITLNGTGANSYSWSGGVTNGTPFSPGSTATYTVTGTNANGCTNTSTVTVSVLTRPTVGAGSNQSVCPGTSVTLNGSGASSYSWTGGITNGVAFTPASTTTYTVTGTAANGCTNTSSVTVTVYTPPTVSGGPNQSICTGASVTLSGSGANSYSWTGGITNGVSFTPGSTTTYTVTGTDGNGCTGTASVTVTVTTSLNVFAGNDTTICSGNSITLTGSGAVNYLWNNGVTNGVPFTPIGTNTYIVNGNDGGSCTDRDTIVVTVLTSPTVGAGSNQTVCEGTNVTLTGSGASSYTWTGGITNGVPFNALSTTTYTVTGTAANGCTGTSTVTVNVNSSPTVSGGSNQSVCAGQSVTLSGAGANSYTWTGGVTNGVSFVPSMNQTYTVTGTDGNGCTNTATVSVTVNALPTISGGSDQTICAGTQLTLSGSGGVSYTWTGGVTNGVPFTPAMNQTYTVTGTDGNGCTNTATVSVTVNALPSVNISTPSVTTYCINDPNVTLSGTPTGGGFTGAGMSGNVFNPSSAGIGSHTITYTYTDGNGCTNQDNLLLDVIACNSLEDITTGGNPVIYPNPGTQQAMIQLPEDWYGRIQIKICALDGKVVNTYQSFVNSKEPVVFETGHLANGVYIFVVEKDNHKAHLRWVKQ